MKNNVRSKDGATHTATQVPPKSKLLLVFQQQYQPRTCATTLTNLSGLLKCLN